MSMCMHCVFFGSYANIQKDMGELVGYEERNLREFNTPRAYQKQENKKQSNKKPTGHVGGGGCCKGESVTKSHNKQEAMEGDVLSGYVGRDEYRT